jgi:hypothetical protein
LGRSRRRPESPGACCVRRSSWRRRQAALRYRVGSRGCKPVGRPLSLPIVEKRIREALAAPRRPRCDCQTVRRGSRDIHFESASRSPRLSCASERTKLFGASRDLAIPRSAAPHDRWHVRSRRFKRVHGYPATGPLRACGKKLDNFSIVNTESLKL